jgi:hypothetical protein
MARIPKTKVYNSQKAEAYVGKGVLRAGGKITPVPNGPLVKKKGEFKGSTLKDGGKIKCWTGYEKQGTKKKGDKTVNNCVKKTMKDGGSTPAWTRKEGKNPEGGLNAKGVASYRAANPGSKLKTAVTTKPSKLKAGSKDAKRRKSFCARMSGVQGPMKKPNGKPTRKALALRKWNC